jgi:hypothetical protein
VEAAICFWYFSWRYLSFSRRSSSSYVLGTTVRAIGILWGWGETDKLILDKNQKQKIS